MKNPQETAHHIVINNAQLQHIIDAMTLLLAQLPTDEVGDTIDNEFDTTDTFYVYPADTLAMLGDILNGDDGRDTIHGLCL